MNKRLFFPATKRNKEPITLLISKFIHNSGIVLEIASGSGEHGVNFQKKFPNIIWQTTDPDAAARESINAWIRHEKFEHKMPKPITLDVRQKPWPLTNKIRKDLKTIICINMLHFTPWKCT